MPKFLTHVTISDIEHTGFNIQLPALLKFLDPKLTVFTTIVKSSFQFFSASSPGPNINHHPLDNSIASVFHRIAMYPVDGVIHLLSNRGQIPTKNENESSLESTDSNSYR